MWGLKRRGIRGSPTAVWAYSSITTGWLRAEGSASPLTFGKGTACSLRAPALMIRCYEYSMMADLIESFMVCI